MNIREMAEHEFLKVTQEARENMKYNPASAKLMIDIIENGETFSREKWLSIYKNKDVPWRADKNLQEVMLRTKGFPDDLCEKILSCAFNKRLYKAALSRNDIGLKNIEIALAGLSERELKKALEAGELSELAVNQIAKRAINRLTYDSEREPDKYELIALKQMTDKHAAKSFLKDVGFEEICEEVITVFANNVKLEEIRDIAFNLGCSPERISVPYTPYMEDIIINGALYSFFDDSTPYRAKQDAKDMLLTAMEGHQLSPEMESKIIKEFVNESKKKYYGDNEVLACLLSNTTSVKIMQEGLLSFPSFAPELIFTNKNTPFPIVAPNVPMELKKLYEMPLNTRAKIATFNAFVNGLKNKIENSWRNARLGDDFYKVITKPDNKIVASKAEFLQLIASAPGTPEEYLNKLLEYRLNEPSEQIIKLIATAKMSALLNKKLSDEKFNHQPQNICFVKLMKAMSDAVMYESSLSAQTFRDTVMEMVSQPEFLEQKEKFINAVKNARKEINDYKVHSSHYISTSAHEDKVFKRVEKYYDNLLDEIKKATEILTALTKKPQECTKEEAEIASTMLLASVLNCAKQRPIEMILGYEDAKAEFIALKERAYELEVKEGKAERKSTIEEVLADGSIMIDAPKTTTTPSKEVPIEVFEI